MTEASKSSEKGFKPGANMPDGDYDPEHEGMSESGNHAAGHEGNDTPHVPQQQGRMPARAEPPARGYRRPS